MVAQDAVDDLQTLLRTSAPDSAHFRLGRPANESPSGGRGDDASVESEDKTSAGCERTMGNPTKLVPDNQLILDAPLLKVPLELIRRNFKSAQRNIDKETKAISASLNEAAQKAQLGSASPDETIASIESMIRRMQTLKRKVCPLSVDVLTPP
jgi:hypothetical protein